MNHLLPPDWKPYKPRVKLPWWQWALKVFFMVVDVLALCLSLSFLFSVWEARAQPASPWPRRLNLIVLTSMAVYGFSRSFTKGKEVPIGAPAFLRYKGLVPITITVCGASVTPVILSPLRAIETTRRFSMPPLLR